MLLALTLLLAGDSDPPPTAGEPPAVTEAPPIGPPRGHTGSPLAGLGGFGGGGSPGYAATWYPTRPVKDQPTELGMVRQRLNVGLPLWRADDGRDMLLGTVRVGHALIDTDAVLPDSRRPVPAELWDLSLGGVYTHTFDNGWTGGAMLNVGSASDRPFAGLREMQVSGGGFLRVPAHRDGDFWNFALMYSPTGQLPFPVPGVSYQWQATDTLRLNLGVPFSLTWTPTDTLTVNLSYLPLTIITARATWRPAERVSLFAAFESGADGFFLAGRERRTDRFQLLEKRLLAGGRVSLIGHLTLDVSGGYAFDRSFGTGQNPLNSSTDRLLVEPGAFLSVGLTRRF
jgi:hypothetical protein